MRPGLVMKQRVKIITVDPSQRRIEAALKDGGMIQVAVWEQAPFFRWPIEGEYWTVRKDGGIWMLDAYMQPADAEHRLEDTPAGSAKINTEAIKTQTGRDVVITDESVSGDGKPLVWDGPSGRWLPNQVSSLGLQDSAVTTGKMADSSVTTGKLANDSVTLDKRDIFPHGVFHIANFVAANTTFQTAGSGAALSTWTTDYEHGGFSTTADGVIHLPVSGWYTYTCWVRWSSASTVGQRYAGISHINPIFNTIKVEQALPNAGSSFTTNLNLTFQGAMTANPTDEGLSVIVWQNSGSPFNGEIYMSVTFLSRH